MKSPRKELAKLHLYSHCNFQSSSDNDDFRNSRLAPLHSLKTGVVIKCTPQGLWGKAFLLAMPKSESWHIVLEELSWQSLLYLLAHTQVPLAGHRYLWHQPSLLGKRNHSLEQLPATKAVTNDIAITEGADNREAIQDYDIKTSRETGRH